jgi:hypothetical protein
VGDAVVVVGSTYFSLAPRHALDEVVCHSADNEPSFPGSEVCRGNLQDGMDWGGMDMPSCDLGALAWLIGAVGVSDELDVSNSWA